MKKALILFISILPIFAFSSNAFAANGNTFSVNNVYDKGNGKFDIVVKGPKKDTLRLYVDGKKSNKAKVNGQGWATFKKVKLSGLTKLTLDRKLDSKYVAVNYTKYVQIDGKRVTLADTGPRHSFNEFYEWSTTERYDALMAAKGSAYQQITAMCVSADRSFGTVWATCMQKGYKDYLKPETFIGSNWQGDYTDMMSHINVIGTEVGKYGGFVEKQSSVYGKEKIEAEKIYNRIAVTD